MMAGVAPAWAGDVALRFNSQDVFVGIPFTLAIDVEAQSDHDPPVFPKLDHADVEDGGQQTSSRSSFQITFNGRTLNRSTSTRYLYRITPRREGPLTIPPIEVRVDGKTLRTPRRVFQVKKAETSDRLFVELTASKDSVYVGEAVDLKLMIWLQPYRQGRINLDHNQMWQQVDKALSDWGPFEELVLSRRPQVQVSQQPRMDADNKARQYFVYELEKTVWPERAGPLDVGDMRIVVDYPLRIRRDNTSFFFNDLSIAQSKTIVGVINKSPVMVKPIPTENRPPYYSGAVGPCRLKATVSPTNARVGDPLTVNLSIAGVGQMELLQPPPVASLPEFAGKFQVDEDRLPGVVNGRVKTFTLSVRALTPDVTEFPAIPFAYFDPDAERFVTVYSDPIPLTISAAEKMSVTQIVESPSGIEEQGGSLTRLEAGIEGNHADPKLVLAQQGFNPGAATVLVVATPPIVWLMSWVGVQLRRKRVSDRALMRRRYAHRNAMRKVAQARKQSNPSDAAALLVTALTGYVADRFDLAAGGLTRIEAVSHLKSCEMDPEIVERVDAALAECEAVEFGGQSGGSQDELADRVKACLDQLEAVRS